MAMRNHWTILYLLFILAALCGRGRELAAAEPASTEPASTEPESTEVAPTRHLILIAGQSNAVGFDAKPGELPASELDRQVRFWWRCGDPPPDEHDSLGRRWSHLQPQPLGRPKLPRENRQYGNFAQPEGGFGPEIGLARTLLTKQPSQPLAMVKAAFSGTGLRTDWDPASDGEAGSCYRALVQETRAAIKAAREDGDPVQLRAMVWVQGESDANAEDASRYEERLRAMLTSLRQDLQAPGLVVLLAVNTRFHEDRNEFVPRIVAAQTAVADADPRVEYVDTSQASIANPVHFDAAGTLEVGRLCADRLLQLEHDKLAARAKPADQVLAVWPDAPPGDSRKLASERDFTKPADRLIAGRRIIKLGNVAQPEAHLYLPPAEKRNGAAVVVCPGGGFHILAWDLEGTEVAEWLNSIGVTAIVLKYRVPTHGVEPPWLPPVQDAQRTISLVRAHADQWQIDVEKIGVLGFSAGAVTAARTALADRRLYVPQDEVDELPYRPNLAVLLYSGGLVNDARTALREDVKVTADAPPMFLTHAFDDRVPAESSVQLFLALKRVEVPAELHVFHAGGHGYGLRNHPQFPVTRWPRQCEAWLRQHKWLEPPAE